MASALSRSTVAALILATTPAHAAADDVGAFVAYYAVAYAKGMDRVPRTPDPIRIDLDTLVPQLTTVKPIEALTGNAFLADDGTVFKLVGAQGCLSTQSVTVDSSGRGADSAPCAKHSIAALRAALSLAIASAGDAFPCHIVDERPSPARVRFGECFFTVNGKATPLSSWLVRGGFAVAGRAADGQPIVPQNVAIEDEARAARSGFWANPRFPHPYGARFKTLSVR